MTADTRKVSIFESSQIRLIMVLFSIGSLSIGLVLGIYGTWYLAGDAVYLLYASIVWLFIFAGIAGLAAWRLLYRGAELAKKTAPKKPLAQPAAPPVQAEVRRRRAAASRQCLDCGTEFAPGDTTCRVCGAPVGEVTE